MDGQSLNLSQERINILKKLMPDVFSEGKLDYERLRISLGENVFVKNEHYELSWAGKSDAQREIQRQTTATLIPDRKTSIDFDQSENVFIEGENLEVLRVLQRSYFGRVKMIYIDPPYNTGNDSFVYPDDYSERLDDYQRRAGLTDEKGFLNKHDLWRTNRRENGQFHSVWMSMMYPRLFLARNLLREDGIIFVSIDDNEASNLKIIMDEIFGEENFVACICWQKKYAVSNDDDGIGKMHDFILSYKKSSLFGRNLLPRTDKQLDRYKNIDDDPRGLWSSDNYVSNKSKTERPTLYYPIIHPRTGEEVWPDENAVWRYSKENHENMVKENRLYWGPKQSYKIPRLKRFLDEIQGGLVPNTWWSFQEVGHNDEAQKETFELLGKKVFSTPKPVRLINKLLDISTSPNSNDIVLDFFAGSATLSQAVLEKNSQDGGNRAFITVQLDELIDEVSEAYKAGYRNIADISRERIRRVIQKIELEISELDIDLVSMLKDRLDLEIKIVELKQNSPELFYDAGHSKIIQKLIAEQTRLEELYNEKRSKLERLKQTPKNFRAFQLAPSNFHVWRANVTSKDRAFL